MRLINLTPHDITIVQEGKPSITIPASGQVARVAETIKPVGLIDTPEGEVVLRHHYYGEIEGLPEPQPDTMFIVSLLVAQAAPYRTDVVSPSGLVRDTQGCPIGCEGLATRHPWERQYRVRVTTRPTIEEFGADRKAAIAAAKLIQTGPGQSVHVDESVDGDPWMEVGL